MDLQGNAWTSLVGALSPSRRVDTCAFDFVHGLPSAEQSSWLTEYRFFTAFPTFPFCMLGGILVRAQHCTVAPQHGTQHIQTQHYNTTTHDFFFSFSFVFLFLFFVHKTASSLLLPPPPTTQRQVQLTADTFANPSPIDRDTIERISGLALDFTIVSAIAVSRFACILCSTSPFPSPRWAGFADITTPALSLLPHHAHHT